MKLILYLCIFFWTVNFSAQDYVRSWGTYYGGVDTRNTLFSQVNGDLHIDNVTEQNNGTSASTAYFNQFITPGMQTFISGEYNNYHLKLNAFGAAVFATYEGIYNTTTDFNYVVHRDKSGSYYRIEQNFSLTANATPLTWITDNNSGQYKILLAKYDAANNLIWRTYLPSNKYYAVVTTDDAGNVYVCNSTYNQNLADANAFMPNYTVSYNPQGEVNPNDYLVKLNSSGQKLWVTYFFDTQKLIYNNGGLYSLNINQAGTQAATSGTFQQTTGGGAIIKMNAVSGQRVWGTFYGPANYSSSITDIAVVESGVYAIGICFNFGNPNSYFATANAFQSAMSGQQNLFLTKFDDTGNRIWSTYFGGDNTEEGSSISVKGNKILICGFSSSSNIATAGAYISAKPNPFKSDFFFSMFTTDGARLFTSYYGAADSTTQSIGYGGTTYAEFSETVNAFYFGGNTSYRYGFTTEGSWQSQIIYPTLQQFGTAGFIAKFVSHNELGTSEDLFIRDLILFNNPNNGKFYIQGSVLSKENCIISIYDTSGKLIFNRKMKNTLKIEIDAQDLLPPGQYFVQVSNSKKEKLKVFKMTVK